MLILIAVISLLMVGCSSKAAGNTTVHIVLDDTTGLNGPLTLTASPAHVPAGTVTFDVTNKGTIDHSLTIIRTASSFDRLPIVDGGDPPASVPAGANEVDEAGKVGGIGKPDLAPGQSRTFTIRLSAGKYVLLSNIAKQYGMGMRSEFTVR